MAIKICPNGHHYNTDDNPTCPYCEKANFSEVSFEWTGVDLTDTADKQKSGQTMNFVQATEPIYVDDSKTKAIYSNTNKKGDKQSSMPESAWSQAEYQQQPVVGWLVCIEGPDKGKDFCLHGAKSTVGRRPDSSICLSDSKISRDGFPALIVYDTRKTHKFYLASGDAASHNNVELRGDLLLGQSVMEPYDEIRIEDTVLVFVPFCGEEFFWDEN